MALVVFNSDDTRDLHFCESESFQIKSFLKKYTIYSFLKYIPGKILFKN